MTDPALRSLEAYSELVTNQNPSLASTFPHHKHVPPEIRRNRVPAPGLSFERPNLPRVLDEIRDLLAGE